MDIDSLLKQMTLKEKIGQLFLLAFSGNRLDEARVLMEERAVGAAYISNDNIPTAKAASELTLALQGFAGNTRLKIPLLLGVDQEGAWGVMVPESATGPGNMALGAASDPDLTYQMYATIAKELSAVGLNALFAPCSDCNSNPDNSIIGMRSFGEKADLVGRLAAAAVKGAQDHGIVATAKHFPGHGDTIMDSHRGLPTVTRSREELLSLDLHPFAQAVKAGVALVMTAHIHFTALDKEKPATLSSKILGDLLRRELGFEGVILSDSMNMGAMKKHYVPEEAVVEALAAGVDLVMLAEEHYDHDPKNYLKNQISLLDAVEKSVQSGRLSQARVDEAVGRVLELKIKFGLFEKIGSAHELKLVGRKEHRDAELKAAQGAIALLKDENKLVPLPKGKDLILVNTTTQSSYVALDGTRGIGPNQVKPAFDLFSEAVHKRRPGTKVVTAEEILEGDLHEALGGDKLVVAVTENFPLPGMDFDQVSQLKVIQKLMAMVGKRLVVVALRDPYELRHFPGVPTYLCAFSFRPCAAEAAAQALFGEIPIKGKSPVSVPGTGVKA